MFQNQFQNKIPIVIPRSVFVPHHPHLETSVTSHTIIAKHKQKD